MLDDAPTLVEIKLLYTLPVCLREDIFVVVALILLLSALTAW